MSIHKIGSDLVRPHSSGGVGRGSATSGREDTDELARVERADRVDISSEGRELAAQLLREGEGLTSSRAALIQRRLGVGYYNDPAIVERVAERLLDSGDLHGAHHVPVGGN